jgi:hydrogenase nickel incorporation protein HypB
VIEGDQQTVNDAARIRATGTPAIQVNTGKGCHLDAQMIADAAPRLPLADHGILFIENVGNLVCPASFDLGERHKVAVLSVTEGEDKPLKYPHMFAAASLMLLNKVDLLPYLNLTLRSAWPAPARSIRILKLFWSPPPAAKAWTSGSPGWRRNDVHRHSGTNLRH